MKVFVLVVWFLLGASYFLLLGMAQERCCNSGVSPADDLIGQKTPMIYDQVGKDSLPNAELPGHVDKIWGAGAIW